MTDIEKKSREELLLEYKRLAEQLDTLQEKYSALEGHLEKQCKLIEEERLEHNQTIEELELAQVIVDQSPAVLFRRKAGEDPTLEYVSENLRQFGYAASDFLNGSIMFKDIVHQDDLERVRDEIRHYADQDVEEYNMVYRILTVDGEARWIEDQTSVVRNAMGEKIHNQGIIIDITERKEAEKKLRKSEEKFRRIVETTAEGFLLMDEELNILDVNKAYCELVGYSKDELIGRKSIELLAEESRPYLEANKEEILANERREFEIELKTKEGKLIPAYVHGNTLRGDGGQIIGHMSFVTDMTEQKKALVLAGEVQKNLLPTKSPDVKKLDIFGRTVSCDEIGGDYYDYFIRDGEKNALSVVVGDIAGHGVDSALLMTTARAFLRMRASQSGTNSEIISEMNSHLAVDMFDSSKFMTLFYLTIDAEKESLSWIRAGHDPALLYDPHTDTFDELKGEGIALGVVDDFQYQEYKKKGLKRGQIIIVGTDGIWEAFNSKDEMFGKQRLQDIIKENHQLPAQELLDCVYSALNSFTFGTKSEDDITLVIIKVDDV